MAPSGRREFAYQAAGHHIAVVFGNQSHGSGKIQSLLVSRNLKAGIVTIRVLPGSRQEVWLQKYGEVQRPGGEDAARP
jgi:hypothetical protein